MVLAEGVAGGLLWLSGPIFGFGLGTEVMLVYKLEALTSECLCYVCVQLCPVYPHNASTLLNDMRSPSEIMDFGDLSDCLSGVAGGPELHVFNPAFDYIPPELVSLFITDT